MAAELEEEERDLADSGSEPVTEGADVARPVNPETDSAVLLAINQADAQQAEATPEEEADETAAATQQIAEKPAEQESEPDALLAALDQLFDVAADEETGLPVDTADRDSTLGQQLAAQDGFARATRQLMNSLGDVV